MNTDNPFHTISTDLKSLRSEIKRLEQILEAGVSPWDWVGIEEAAEKLLCSKSKLYKQCQLGEIPHKKKGNKLYFNLRDLSAWIENM